MGSPHILVGSRVGTVPSHHLGKEKKSVDVSVSVAVKEPVRCHRQELAREREGEDKPQVERARRVACCKRGVVERPLRLCLLACSQPGGRVFRFCCICSLARLPTPDASWRRAWRWENKTLTGPCTSLTAEGVTATATDQAPLTGDPGTCQRAASELGGRETPHGCRRTHSLSAASPTEPSSPPALRPSWCRCPSSYLGGGRSATCVESRKLNLLGHQRFGNPFLCSTQLPNLHRIRPPS